MVPESIQVLSTVRDLFLKFTEKNTFFPLITSPVHFPLAGKYSLHIIFFFLGLYILCKLDRNNFVLEKSLSVRSLSTKKC